jgi:hypothetical protein
MVTDHLTPTETEFLLTFRSRFKQDIAWHELFMSESLCRYGLQQCTKKCPFEFLEAIATTAPYEILVLPDISKLFRQHTKFFKLIIDVIIKAHRPLFILVYMLQLYHCSCHDGFADEFCDDAAAANNTEALSWLRDPDTGDGVFHWSHWTCASAAKHGHTDMLEHLRDPNIDGGVCPWGQYTCSGAVRAGQLQTLIWLRDPEKGGGVCPWEKERCLSIARHYNYSTMVAWIMAQPDGDEN